MMAIASGTASVASTSLLPRYSLLLPAIDVTPCTCILSANDRSSSHTIIWFLQVPKRVHAVTGPSNRIGHSHANVPGASPPSTHRPRKENNPLRVVPWNSAGTRLREELSHPREYLVRRRRGCASGRRKAQFQGGLILGPTQEIFCRCDKIGILDRLAHNPWVWEIGTIKPPTPPPPSLFLLKAHIEFQSFSPALSPSAGSLSPSISPSPSTSYLCIRLASLSSHIGPTIDPSTPCQGATTPASDCPATMEAL